MRTAFVAFIALAFVTSVAPPAQAETQTKSYLPGAGDLICLSSVHPALARIGCVSFIVPGGGETGGIGWGIRSTFTIRDDVNNPVGGSVCTNPRCAGGIAVSFCGSVIVDNLQQGKPVYVLIHEVKGLIDCAPDLGAGIKGTVTAEFEYGYPEE